MNIEQSNFDLGSPDSWSSVRADFGSLDRPLLARPRVVQKFIKQNGVTRKQNSNNTRVIICDMIEDVDFDGPSPVEQSSVQPNFFAVG